MRVIGFFKEFAAVHNLLSCDDLLPTGNVYSYHHDSLGHTSLLDNLFIDLNLKRHLVGYDINCDGANTSDHFPVACYFGDFTGVNETPQDKPVSKLVYERRWDKRDLAAHYECTHTMLDKIEHVFTCDVHELGCVSSDHNIDTEIYYNEIIHALKMSADLHVPVVPRSALKHYWPVELDDLKEQSKISYDL